MLKHNRGSFPQSCLEIKFEVAIERIETMAAAKSSFPGYELHFFAYKPMVAWDY